MVLIKVLGSFAAQAGSEEIPLGGPRQRGVLALLVAARGHVVSVDRLIDDLWRGEPPARALTSLQAYVSNLRRLLEPDRLPRTPARVLVSAAPGYAIRLPTHAVDAWHFEQLLDDARATDDPAAAYSMLTEALTLWRGPAFAEVADEPWVAAEVARLTELQWVARELRIATGLRLGDPTTVLPEADRLTRDAPLREEGWRLSALARWASGRQGDALAALRQARTMLSDELGLDPGPDLVALEEAILSQRTEVLRAAVPLRPTVSTTTDGAHRSSRTGQPEPTRTVFVGRDRELAALIATANETELGGLRVALVSGEAGLGKSTLLDHLAARLTRDGWLVATGRCPDVGTAPSAWAWVETLREVAAVEPPPEDLAATLAPFLTDSSEAATSGDTEASVGRFRLRRAVLAWCAAVAATRPLAILLDDVHAADAATRELLAACVELRAPVLLVVAYRGDEAQHLTETLGILARVGPKRIELQGLPEDAVAEVVRAECAADDSTIAGIAQRTGGNPFYVRESARLLHGEGALIALSEVPDGVRDVLRRRFARLPEAGVSVLRLAAVAGRESAIETIVRAADTDEDGVLNALDAGVIAGLLDEPAPGRVRFVHALVRDTLITDVSKLRVTRMHARIGAALESTGDVAALAHHYARAGSPKAVEYCVKAAELAEARYAHDVTVTLLTDAVAIATDPVERVEVFGKLLRAQIRAGDFVAARRTRARSIEFAESLGRDDLIIASFTAWTVPTPWQARPYGTVDQPIVGLLTRLLDRTDLAPQVRCHLLIAYAHELVGEADPSVAKAAQEALELAPNAHMRAAALLILARDPGLAEYSRELIAVSVEHDLPVYRVTGLLSHAAHAANDNDPVAMRELSREALDLARGYHMPEATGAAEIALATLLVVEGRYADADRAYRDATDRMGRAGSAHAAGFFQLAEAAIWLNEGTLGTHLDEVRALHASFGEMGADLLVLALVAAGRDAEAHELGIGRTPIRPDFFYSFLMSVRAMAAIAVLDHAAAADIYARLLPYRDGPPAGIESLSLAVRPVSLTLGELALMLGRTDEATEHFAVATRIAKVWNAPQWTAARPA
ncbi:BTAD domain-containing putative transcriptional regulator [Nocardia camponoti]|nr:BTAD domain-containing putative transcriptional regulator [Nocardia camponoti]